MAALSSEIVDSLALWPPLKNASTALIYMPLADEINMGELAERLPEVKLTTTRTPERGGVLTVHELGGPLQVHRYGFLQPHPTAPQVAPGDVGVLLLPGLAFDLWGVRLGRGAGYYDELLSRVAPDALRVGVVPTACVVDALPQDPHDQPVGYLATEEGVIEVAG